MSLILFSHRNTNLHRREGDVFLWSHQRHLRQLQQSPIFVVLLHDYRKVFRNFHFGSWFSRTSSTAQLCKYISFRSLTLKFICSSVLRWYVSLIQSIFICSSLSGYRCLFNFTTITDIYGREIIRLETVFVYFCLESFDLAKLELVRQGIHCLKLQTR